MATKLYAIPGSHPAACAEAALRLKGVPHLHRVHQRLRFGRRTVPSLLDGRLKFVGSRHIVRHLDERSGEPRLYPDDPERRRAVEDAELGADAELQEVVRRLAWVALRRAPRHMPSYTAGSNLPVPQIGVRLCAVAFARLGARLNAASDATLAADVAALRGAIDHVDELIAAGVLDGPEPNAADLQIGSGLALAATFADLAPLIAQRPAGGLVERHFADFPGHMPAGTLETVPRA